MNFTDKTILVSGGANGIGAATALECAALGASVIVADRDEQRGAAVAERCGGFFLPVDVADEQSVRAMYAAIAQRCGRLNVLLHTAGILKGAYVELPDFSADTWQQVLDVNALGSFLCAKHAVPLMQAAGGGVIVLVTSGAAQGVSSSYAYGASKAALNNLGLALAARLAPDKIRVNLVSPGGIDTEMKRSVIAADLERQGKIGQMEQAVREQDLGEPRGVARILAWLASDDADYVRGVISTR